MSSRGSALRPCPGEDQQGLPVRGALGRTVAGSQPHVGDTDGAVDVVLVGQAVGCVEWAMSLSLLMRFGAMKLQSSAPSLVRKAWSWPSLAPATTIRLPFAVERTFWVRKAAKALAVSRMSRKYCAGVPTVIGLERKVSPSFQLSGLWALSPRMNPTTSFRLVSSATLRSVLEMFDVVKEVSEPDL